MERGKAEGERWGRKRKSGGSRVALRGYWGTSTTVRAEEFNISSLTGLAAKKIGNDTKYFSSLHRWYGSTQSLTHRHKGHVYHSKILCTHKWISKWIPQRSFLTAVNNHPTTGSASDSQIQNILICSWNFCLFVWLTFLFKLKNKRQAGTGRLYLWSKTKHWWNYGLLWW